MKIRELFEKDPLQSTLLNNGVAEVAAIRTEEQLRTLRYELETFVCEGEYARGLSRILNTYLQNLSQSEQAAVWVSGFFGSGKSHFVKMLRYLWTDYEFQDGAMARGVAKLPTEITDSLKELSTRGKQFGALHAVAGTLGAGAGDSVRLALLGMVFQSVGLPAAYPRARFLLRLRNSGFLEKVKLNVEKTGKRFEQELSHMYVSTVLAEALLAADPKFASNVAEAKSLLKNQYPHRDDASTEEMADAIQEALATKDGKFPCTLIVIDELQQYIGENPDRSENVQQVVEACCKHFGARLLFVATGQTALTGTPHLQKLVARFRIPIQLSDTDVERVIRKIVLAKKPDKVSSIEKVFSTYSGEIHRHLMGTKIETRGEDKNWYTSDYPLLPVRRRFWEKVLRAVDVAGTAGQLRNQLKIVHEAVRASAEKELANVLPGDFIYDQISTDLLSTGVLLREIDEVVKKHRDGTPDGELRSRICALTFLIGKLPRETGADIGLRATQETLADLLVENLVEGSVNLRKKIPELLDQLVATGHVMRVDSEYRMQTREGSAWEADFKDNFTRTTNDAQRIAGERTDLLKQRLAEQLRSVKLMQGTSRVPRKIETFFGSEKPMPTGQAIPIWVRDGWQDDEKSVLADARAAGVESPMLFVFVPRRSADDLKLAIGSWKAASDTLNTRGNPTTPEGIEARQAMETRRLEAERKLQMLLDDIVGATKVFQAGGNEVVVGMFLPDKVQDAAEDALVRLYPQFSLADNPNWEKVLKCAREGDGNALEAIGYTGEADKQAICAAILAEVGAGKRGSEIRKHFSLNPYGWPQDAIDGALTVLVGSGHVRASQAGKILTVREIDQTKIGVTDFRSETITINAAQRVAIRKLLQEAKLACKPNEEASVIPTFLQQMKELAGQASGDPPCPDRPSTLYIDEIALRSGNEQLLAAFEARDRLVADVKAWSAIAEVIKQRFPRWTTLLQFVDHASSLPVAEEVRTQIDAIMNQRLLLADPDHVPTLCENVASELRQALISAHKAYSKVHETQIRVLETNDAWSKLTKDQRTAILRKYGIADIPSVEVGTEGELLDSLNDISLDSWADRRDALTQRFANALTDTIKETEPKAVRIQLPTATIRNEQDLDAWLDNAKEVIKDKLKDGPVVI